MLLQSRIRHETPDQKNLEALPYLLIPATYEEAALWIARLLAHFPRRESIKDAIIISDVAGDMVENNISLVVVVAVCDDLRRRATEKTPFLPPSGEILLRAKDKMDSFKIMVEGWNFAVALIENSLKGEE